MSSEIVFYTNPMSRGRVVRWMLEEVGRPYRTELLGFATSMKDPAYLAINPMGKVPAIVHGGTVVTEGAAICAYLADAFPEAGLAPAPGDPRRGPYYRWMFFAAGPLEAALTNRSLGFEVPAERKRMMGYGSVEDAVNTLDYAVTQSEFIAGDRFTAADVYVGSHIGWAMMFGTLEKRPSFEAYWNRISSRPAAIRAREIDDALVAQEQAKAASS
ncbi:glutathione S-transferase family protein [Microvirga lenta]|uniref:glutathione S-transferase family protein n=1 Tax=Microvirga lenta TaxID=2881337 RepID=UPI001CFFA6D7|nr:glutathione S-transferase family protein [Microvirga lenta]MCB5177493.1 glutathione S-transferase family protein [Microvirga lenta]